MVKHYALSVTLQLKLHKITTRLHAFPRLVLLKQKLFRGCVLPTLQQLSASDLFQLAYAIHGVIGSPSMGMFALGMLVPWSNTVVSLFPWEFC